jgi:hypothetical protein
MCLGLLCMWCFFKNAFSKKALFFFTLPRLSLSLFLSLSFLLSFSLSIMRLLTIPLCFSTSQQPPWLCVLPSESTNKLKRASHPICLLLGFSSLEFWWYSMKIYCPTFILFSRKELIKNNLICYCKKQKYILWKCKF